MEKTWRRVIASFFFFFILVLPVGLMAQKEEVSTLQEKKQGASYSDFDDILIPAELALDKKNSFVYGMIRSKVGLLILDGRVEPSSLANFFQNNMRKDGWRLLSSFKYRQYMMVFLKEDRACIITILEKSFSTKVEARVGPIESDPGKGLPSR
jgi:hypothetical protein